MSRVVLDSSAILAMLLHEPGGEVVAQELFGAVHSFAISAVNWTEVLARLQRENDNFKMGSLASSMPSVEIVPFSEADAEATARLAKQCAALSLGDRACLSLAASRKAVAWTTDKIWARMNVGAELRILR